MDPTEIPGRPRETELWITSFRQMHGLRTLLFPPFLLEFPGLDVVLGTRLTIRAKGNDIGTSFLVFAWTHDHQKMSPGIFGFGFERFVLDPLFGGGAFAAIGKPVLKNHGAQLLDLHARDHDLSINGALAQTNDNSAHDQSHQGEHKHDLDHREARRLSSAEKPRSRLNHASNYFRKRANDPEVGISWRSPLAGSISRGLAVPWHRRAPQSRHFGILNIDLFPAPIPHCHRH